VASRVDLGSGAVTFFTRRLRRAGSPARAIGEKAYLKSDLRFWGTTQDSIRSTVREYCDAHPDLTRADLRAIAEALYATDVHELRAAAIGVLERDCETLDDRDMPWLIALVRMSKSWAYVDWIAPKVIGDVIARDARTRKRLAVWAKDGDFWVRRTALLAEHDALRAGGGDFALWSRLAASMLDEREFFIRKAIGWVLREVSKKRPELTYAFLRKHRDRVSRLSLLEGAKYLPAPKRRALGLPGEAAWVAREARRKAASGRR
jgi:3-methyladenine DNA glycosylase AlkD